MPIINTDLPENALVNVRNEVSLFFGDSNKTDPRITDMLIDEAVKKIHRRWHPSWAIVYDDDYAIPAGNGVLQLPSACKKLIDVTSQDNDPETVLKYKRGVDYHRRWNNTERVWEIHWISPDDSEDLDVRLVYYRKPIRAVSDEDLVDMDDDGIDLVKKGAELEYFILKSNLQEYERKAPKFEKLLQEWIDDDTDPDITDDYRPIYGDGSIPDYGTGEIA